MNRTWLLALCPFVLAILAAPLSVLAGQAGERDSASIYLMLASQLERADAANIEVREVSPQQPMLARLVFVSPQIHEELVAQKYWLIPAGLIADICGISSFTTAQIAREH